MPRQKMTAMDYSNLIPKEQLATVATGVIRRYRQDASEQDCAELTNAFLILAKYLNNFHTGEFYVKIDCSEAEFQQLNVMATSYKETFETWSELIGLSPIEVRYNVRLAKGFSIICNEIAVRLNGKAAEFDREPIKVLGIDIETFSSVDIASCGLYKYAESEDFTILLFAYACDDKPVQIVDFASGDELPERIFQALTDPKILKTAFNASFERICIGQYYGVELPIEQWECTMVRSAMLGLPLSLAQVGKVLNLDDQKMSEGKALIKYFSCPCKPTKTNGGRVRNLPEHAPDKWGIFKQYCMRDVEVERTIRNKTKSFSIPESEKELYIYDQRINDRGVLVDMDFVKHAIRMDTLYKGRLNAEAAEISGLDNPNSVAQLKAWLEKETGNEIATLSKKDIPDLLKASDNDIVGRMLCIRQEMAKTSTKKYEAMEKAACADNRVRGLLQFYGANRTGRWAGRLVQVQNLPQNHIDDLDYARTLVKEGDLDMLEMMYGNVPDTLSQLIRTAFIAKPGCTFIVCDFSAIEARVIAWLAGEQWRLDVFRTHGKIYEATAALMYHVSPDEITKTDPRRQKGKIAELACVAEGQLVLTDFGFVPIEHVDTSMKVWDGFDFVEHGGVIYKGIKKVISYGGITATEDHLVWIEGKEGPIQFGESANSGSHLQQSFPSWENLWKCGNYKSRKEIYQRLVASLCSHKMYPLRRHPMDILSESNAEKICRMPKVLPTPKNPEVARSSIYRGKAKMRKSQRCKLQKLRGTWNQILFFFGFRGRPMDDSELRSSRSHDGIGQNRCERKLRARKPSLGNASTELYKPAKVYDIINCGPRNRYTVNGVLVHNCGYQGGVGAMKSMGGEKMGLSEAEMQEIVTHWRKANPAIVKLWDKVQEAAIACIESKSTTTIGGGVDFYMRLGALMIYLPSGRVLSYPRPYIGENRFGAKSICYEGLNQTTKQWGKQETYGGKLVENIVQAIARDCLALTILRLEKHGYPIVFHVHDEVIIEARTDGSQTLEAVEEIFKQPIPWAEDLPLKGAGYITDYYLKD